MTSNSASPGVVTSSTQGLGLFPAGQKQASVQLPALMLQLEAKDIRVGASGTAVLEAVNAAVAAGATAVILADTGSQAGAAVLYEVRVWPLCSAWLHLITRCD